MGSYGSGSGIGLTILSSSHESIGNIYEFEIRMAKSRELDGDCKGGSHAGRPPNAINKVCSLQPRGPQKLSAIKPGLLRSHPNEPTACCEGVLWLHFARFLCVEHTGSSADDGFLFAFR